MTEPSPTMGCDARGGELSAYLDGELDPRERARLDAHLGSCGPCRRALAASRELDARIRALPGIAGSPGLEERLRAVLVRAPAGGRARAQPPGGAAAARPRPLWVHVVPWAVAACVLVALASQRPTPILPEDEADWSLIAESDPAQFELMLSEDHDLLYALDLLESWEEEDQS